MKKPLLLLMTLIALCSFDDPKPKQNNQQPVQPPQPKVRVFYLDSIPESMAQLLFYSIDKSSAEHNAIKELQTFLQQNLKMRIDSTVKK